MFLTSFPPGKFIITATGILEAAFFFCADTVTEKSTIKKIHRDRVNLFIIIACMMIKDKNDSITKDRINVLSRSS